MHGIMSGLSLVRDAVEKDDWENVRSILDVTESSGHTLRTTLNDVLDFGRAINPSEGRELTHSIDLAQAAKDAAVMCSAQFVDPNGNVS